MKKQETHVGPQPAKATTLEKGVARDFSASVLGKNQVPFTGESTSRSLADPQETCCVQWAVLRFCEREEQWSEVRGSRSCSENTSRHEAGLAVSSVGQGPAGHCRRQGRGGEGRRREEKGGDGDGKYL